MYVSYSQMAVLVYVSRIFLYIYVITCIYCSFIIMLCQYLIFFTDLLDFCSFAEKVTIKVK